MIDTLAGHAPLPQVDDEQPLGKTAKMLQVLGDERRLTLVRSLASGQRCVCELVEALGLPQNLVSHHLRVLKESGLVSDERRGRWVYYSLNAEVVQELCSEITGLCRCSNVERGPAVCPE